ncbi:splicing factor 3B subunit 1-like isoform X2 [Asparagus officinalis]|nr:splicing factor 3B subunit 1-like isoform X1 [Asparagus officinalis]XP_020268187.1 splicing factor 3B subunit 1-like isoform X2 [Asparagus officinalis]
MNKVLPSCDEDKVRPLVSRIILVAQPFVEDASSHCCIKASEIIYTLSKITGLDEIAVLIRLQMNDSSDYVRDVAVKVMGIVASALGIHVVFPFIESCCRRIEPLRVRCAAIRMAEQFAVRIGCTLLPHLSPLIELMELGLLHKDLEIMRITALSLAALAKAVAPYGYEHFINRYCIDSSISSAEMELVLFIEEGKCWERW